MSVQDYIDHALGALPKWFSNNDRSYENIKAFAEIFQRAQEQNDFWRSQANILDAVGATATEPDWLGQHAVDRDTRRQENETDPALLDRLRTFPDALNLGAVLATAQGIVDAESINGTVAVFELRPNRAFFVTRAAQSGTGGVFSGTAPNMVFTPTAPLQRMNPKYDTVDSHRIDVSGAATAGNDTVAVVDGISGDGAAYQNALGVAETDLGVSWSVSCLDALGNVLDGRRQSYFNRGYRMGSALPTIVVILPYGDLLGPHCTDATRLSVIEALRQKRGAGTRVIVECRANP